MIDMPAPDFHPDQRRPDQIPPTEQYQPRDPVWVFRHGEWHVGVVDGVSPLAVMVTYQRAGMRGTVVDTVPPEYLAARDASEVGGGQA